MGKYRKKPVVIDAEQYREDQPWPRGTCGDIECGYSPVAHIHTLEGTMSVSDGDWIIRGVAGEFYPCKPDIFEQTYEPAWRAEHD